MQCIILYSLQIPCPGSQLSNTPGGDFCRLIALSDGSIINQEPVTEHLCSVPSVKYTKGKIGQDFLDTKGKLSRHFNVLKLISFDYIKQIKEL